MARERRLDRRTAAVERHMHQIKPERQPEQLAGETPGRAAAGGCITVFAGIGFHQRDELREILCRNGRVHRTSLCRLVLISLARINVWS
jgi:hypothetical protein